MTKQHHTDPKELSPSAADMASHARSNLALLFKLENKPKAKVCIINNPEDCFNVNLCEQCSDNANNG